MGSPFPNEVAGGNGVLLIPAIQSPNFSESAQTGWAIMQNGDAYFFNLTAEGTITASQFIGTDFIMASQGLFFYNGTPSLGNPPIFAVCAPGTTSDPYGNTVNAVLNVGVLTAAHLGVDDSGNLYLADSTGDNRIYMSPSNTVLSFYTAGTAALAMTLAASAGTEPLTHTAYPAGLKIYGSNGSYVQLSDTGSGPAIATAQFSGGGADEQFPGKILTYIRGATPYTEEMAIIGPEFNSPANDYVWIGFQSRASDNSGAAGGNLYYVNTAGAQTALLEWGLGGIFARNILDGNAYDVQRKTLFAGGQNVSSASFVGVSGISAVSTGAQTYRIRGKILMETIGAGAAILAFSGPALGSGEISWTVNDVANGVGAVNLYAWRTVSTLNGITSPAFAATHLWTVDIDGQFTFNAAGTTFGLEAATSGGGNFDILAGSYLDLMPVTV